jgi:predicted Rossmann-fold nucleotide-binding protein
MFRVIVAGSRHFADYDLLRDRLDAWLSRRLAETAEVLGGRVPAVLVVSGGAPGADTLGERYARERGLLWVRFPADWAGLGPAGGPARNAEMARNADALALFDGGGPGSRSMRGIAGRAGLPVKSVRV